MDCYEKTSKHYCYSCFSKIKQHFTSAMDEIYPEAKEIYIGRTNYPEKRLLEHFIRSDRNHLSVIHWASSMQEIADIEEYFIKECQSRLKAANKDPLSDGKIYGEYNCLYISWSEKSKSKWDSEQYEIPIIKIDGSWQLDDGFRIFPEMPGEFETIHLIAPYSKSTALEARENIDSNRAKFWEKRKYRLMKAKKIT